jgi:hypothetical protein
VGFWDSFGSGDRFKFINPGDTIEGEVIGLSATDFGGTADPTPVLTIRTDQGDKDVTASQTVLVSRLAEQAPEVGDHIMIRYDGEAANARPGRSPAKLFTVTVKRGSQPAAPSPDNPKDVPEAWQGQSDEPF